MTAVIGIDPGLAVGIATLFSGQQPLAWNMPETERDVFNLLYYMTIDSSTTHAYIEQVHSMPKQGVASSFKFGMGYGGLRMALIAAKIPFTTVTPGKWQQAMQCRSGGDKNVTKRRAQELFPSLTVTHALADALLIASYGYQQVTGKPWTGG